MSLAIIILAAGKGTRMRSAKPKVLHELAGQSLLAHVLNTAIQLNPSDICIVYGHGGQQLQHAFAEFKVEPSLHWVEQSPQLGTGHAVQQALPAVAAVDHVLVLYADVPLIQAATLNRLMAVADRDKLALLTAQLADPYGYGRIVRDAAGAVIAIVEERDATVEQQAITEVNTGIMLAPTLKLTDWLGRIDNNNSQAEYYLTDIIELAVHDAVPVVTAQVGNKEQVLGINTQQQLVELERYQQQQIAERLLDAGVTVKDPQRLDVRGELTAGQDVTIDVNVVIEGRVVVGNNVVIEPFTLLRDCEIGDNTRICSHSVVEQSRIGADCQVGPYARIRPDTVLADQAKIGNFVEVKKSTIGHGSKINHLSYIGDTEIGRAVNVGAGTITCNYDGANKHKTIIRDGAFIGSDSQLVAPVTVGANTTVGAGSTITRDTPDGGLVLTRVKQAHFKHWQRPKKNKDE